MVVQANAEVGVGDKAPTIVLPDVTTGQSVDVTEHLKGAPGAIVFMQTSCSACRREMKALKSIVATYPDFKVVAVSVDGSGPDRVVRYREKHELAFLFVHDPDYVTPETFGFSYTPSLVLVTREGLVDELKGGFRPSDKDYLAEKIASYFK